MLFVLFYLITWVLASMAGTSAEGTTMLNANITTKPGCASKCGNLEIHYPFGIEPGCYLSPLYSLTCNTSYDPHRAFLFNNFQIQNFSENPRSIHEILDISIPDNQIQIRNMVSYECANPKTKSMKQGMLLPPASPFIFSTKGNMITTVGCEFTSEIKDHDQNIIRITSSYCQKENVTSGKCLSTNGCAEEEITNNNISEFYIDVVRPRTSSIPYDRCGYGFIGESNAFKFQGLSDFSEPDAFKERILQNVHLVVDWAIGNQTCDEARKNGSSYVCQNNTSCRNTNSGTGGYHCSCVADYEGNPYLPPGCTKIIRTNTSTCDGGICVLEPHMRLIIGLGVTFFFLAISVSWIYMIIRKHKSIKMKKELFTKNGGLLLKGQLSSMSSPGSGIAPVKIFTEKELKIATNNFSGDNIAGRGGSGVVYKGCLDDQSLIAIKKAIIVDEVQIDQFINELIILSQINHRNVVKLLGCCLEVEVPLLIYEFIPNGALFNHLHNDVHLPWLDWRNCLRIISEIANALTYLHCSANFPIIHRDIKSANILLDDNYIAKISDFGASRLIPVDQTKHCTAVQGTLGYLDPEYMFTSQLTEKSDVFSFGVLVAEILTRKKAIFSTKGLVYRNLATYFVESVWKGEVASIMDAQVVESARKKEVTFVAEIVCKCLATKGEDRPTMTDVAAKLDELANRVLC